MPVYPGVLSVISFFLSVLCGQLLIFLIFTSAYSLSSVIRFCCCFAFAKGQGLMAKC